jgi:hypothetical protein
MLNSVRPFQSRRNSDVIAGVAALSNADEHAPLAVISAGSRVAVAGDVPVMLT